MGYKVPLECEVFSPNGGTYHVEVITLNEDTFTYVISGDDEIRLGHREEIADFTGSVGEITSNGTGV